MRHLEDSVRSLTFLEEGKWVTIGIITQQQQNFHWELHTPQFPHSEFRQMTFYCESCSYFDIDLDAASCMLKKSAVIKCCNTTFFFVFY